jgi:hypothetical protein
MITKILKSAIILAVMLCTTVWANELYMEQSGDNSTITITQDGASNLIGTQLNPATIGGGSNTVTIDQIGSGNELYFTVNGASTSMVVNVLGSNNISNITCGSGASASCSGSTIWQNITGDGNQATQSLGTGANHESKISVTGDTNTVTHTSTNSGAVSMHYTIAGDLNNVSVTTSGTTAKTLNATTTGSSNTVTIIQTN